MKSLAKDTALYGLSSIIGKLLNWLLVPLYVVKVNNYEFGEITQLYAWTGLLLVLLTYGMETGFFRFANKSENSDPSLVYTTGLTSIWVTTALFLTTALLCIHPIAAGLGFTGNEHYIVIMSIVIAADVIASLPFAYLRYQKKPLRFASIKLLSIFVNIGLNLFFLIVCPVIWQKNSTLISWFYSPETSGVYYIVLSNLIHVGVMLFALRQELFGIKYRFCKKLLFEMLRYSFPLLILGVAGIISQTADKILLPILIEDPIEAKSQLGIYGANFKFAVVMIMFIQAFRFAYEPFVFGKNRDTDPKKSYIEAMKYFIIFGLLIFIGVGLLINFLPHLPLVQRHISPEYFSGLIVVPIVMMAEFFFGIFFNLSFWYKLTDKTAWGAGFSLLGCFLTVLLNIALVPHFGYIACAWIAFVVYFIMMITSYILGQKHYPIAYDLKNARLYIILAGTIYAFGMLAPINNLSVLFGVRLLLIILYIGVVVYKETTLFQHPLINKNQKTDDHNNQPIP